MAHEEGRYSKLGLEYSYTDHLGNVRLMFQDSSGIAAITQTENFGAWGESLKSLNYYRGATGKEQFVFTGHERDEDLGVFDAKARIYDPLVPRFWSIDSYADAFVHLTPYNYAMNNPVFNVDPSGDSSVNAQELNMRTFDVNNDVVQLNEVTVSSKNSSSSSLNTPTGTQVMSPVSGFWGWAGQFWNGNRTYWDSREVNSDGFLLSTRKPVTGMPPDASFGKIGSITKIGNSFRTILGTYSWSSQRLGQAAKELLSGKSVIKVASRAEAEELFLGLFQGKGFRNTTGMSAKEAKYFIGKSSTYHWDDAVDEAGRLMNHSASNAHGAMKHLQIHDESGQIIRIFFEK